jgi:hypothetical protein
MISRLTEKSVVKSWLMPAISDCYLDDQFGLRPTGNTTCALLYLTHHVTEMLETIFIRSLFVCGFFKAFDVVDHHVYAR